MSGTIEQLYYTWATRGTEGVNRFQIAAVSPGLKGGSLTRQLPALRRLCQYEQSSSTNAKPVSFGWLDHAGLRIAFWRVGLDPLRGKQGNFAAHLLIGRPETMPESELALRFESPFWWQGGGLADPAHIPDPSSFVLPQITLADICESDLSEHPAGADALAGALLELRRGERLAVDTESWELGRSLRAIAVTFPEAFDGVTVSTYETRPVVPFRLLGSQAAPSTYRKLTAHQGDSEEPSILSRLRESERAGRALRELSDQTIKDPDERRAAFWAQARSLVAVATGTATSSQTLARAMSHPAGAAYIIGEDVGRERIVDALMTCSEEVATALSDQGQAIGSEDLGQLARALAVRYETSPTIRGCGQTVRALTGAGAPLAHQVVKVTVRRALAEPELADTLTSQDALMLIRAIARSQPKSDTPGLLALLARSAEALPRIASERIVSDDTLMIMLRLWLPSEKATGAELAQVIRARPALLPSAAVSPEDASRSGRALDREDQGRCLELLAELRGEDLIDALTALLPALNHPSHEPAVQTKLHGLTLEAASRCLTRQKPPALEHTLISGLCEDHAARWLARYLAQAGADQQAGFRSQQLTAADAALARAVALTHNSRSADHPLAWRLLRSLQPGSRTDPLTVLADSPQLTNRQLSQSIAQVALDRALHRAGTREQITGIWNQLTRQIPGQSPTACLESMLAAAWRGRGTRANDLLLFWVAFDLMPAVDEIDIRRGKLRSPQLQKLCLNVARHCQTERLEMLAHDLEGSPHKVRSWWGTLIDESRVRQRRMPRLIRSA